MNPFSLPEHRIAYYLGQYQPTEENNAIWGPGFSEWHKVAAARPLFPGHRQPVLPGQLGFYDLRYEGTLDSQIQAARSLGINAFCYWHYWFAGKRALFQTFDKILTRCPSDFSLMLGWANESWTGIWHGNPESVFIRQSYSKTEMDEHTSLLTNYFANPRYLKHNGRPLLLIYKPRNIDGDYLYAFKEQLRKKAGIAPYLIANWSGAPSERFRGVANTAFDNCVITPVGFYHSSAMLDTGYRIVMRILRKIGAGPEIRSFGSVDRIQAMANRFITGPRLQSIVTGWDNTPRSHRRGLVLAGLNRKSFRSHVQHALSLSVLHASDFSGIFIKSWNEWAEGNTLESMFGKGSQTSDLLQETIRSCFTGTQNDL